VKGVGGTPGGLGSFGAGLLMTAGGAYLLSQQITIPSHFCRWLGLHPFGLALLPLVAGAGCLCLDGKSRAGRLLVTGGVVIVLLGILTNPRPHFEPTSLVDTLLRLALLAGGIILLARSLGPLPPPEPPEA
jgi:hypothetical protein